MFFYVENLTQLSCKSEVLPWNFKGGEILAQVRTDKIARQAFYKSPDTKHYFYSGLEGANPGMRVSKENPPRAIHAFAADYDLKIPTERVNEAIVAMPIKPSWVERSIGGNVRLIWTLPRPAPTETYEFCAFILDKAVAWLQLGLLPGLDEGAFTSPTRLLCAGDWKPTGHPEIPSAALQAFFVSCGKEFRFSGSEGGATIPLDVVETELKKRYPSFSWPSDFLPDSQGPSFWLPESVSPSSAILKPEGFITFAAHAAKPFYSWADLLGVEFVKQFNEANISKATQDIYWDGKNFWKKKGGVYKSLESPELGNYFKVQCRISSKPNSSGLSDVEVAMDHIYNSGAVDGAAPFVFRPPGIITFQGKKILNTYRNHSIPPAPVPAKWPDDFPFMSALLESLFDPPLQMEHFLAWWKHAYAAAIDQVPMPGQNIFLMGGVGVGKTLLNREIVGRSLGGHVDASDFLIRGGAFNSELFDSPLWCIDDESAAESESTRQNFATTLKKCTANSTFRHNKKFEVASMVAWEGRIIGTTNLDYVSSRLLGSMDNSSQDKTSLFRCQSESKIIFPHRVKLIATVVSELPRFLRWLQDWSPPANVIPDVRFGYRSYHEPALLEQSHQGGRSAPFQELLIESLTEWFRDHPTEKEWRGTVTKIIRLLHNNPLNEHILRSMRLEQTARYLEAIQRSGLLKGTVETGVMKERLWVFSKL